MLWWTRCWIGHRCYLLLHTSIVFPVLVCPSFLQLCMYFFSDFTFIFFLGISKFKLFFFFVWFFSTSSTVLHLICLPSLCLVGGTISFPFYCHIALDSNFMAFRGLFILPTATVCLFFISHQRPPQYFNPLISLLCVIYVIYLIIILQLSIPLFISCRTFPISILFIHCVLNYPVTLSYFLTGACLFHLSN